MTSRPARFRRYRPPVAPVRDTAVRPAAGAVHEPAPEAPVPAPAPAALVATEAPAGLDPRGGATLLRLARERWQVGDWAALVSVPASALQHSPDPGRLALMVASAHLQLGQRELARQFVQRATHWGVDRHLLAQTLIAGLHDTLGRAASLQGDDALAQTHFTAALALASPACVSVSAARARADAQMRALSTTTLTAGDEASTTPASPLTGSLLTVLDGPRRLGSVAPGQPWVQTVTAAADGVSLIAWLTPQQTLMLQALDRAGQPGAIRELTLDGRTACAATPAAMPTLGCDGLGHWLLLWCDDAGQLRCRRSAEPSDPRPWSATRSLPATAASSHIDMLPAHGGAPALAAATGPAGLNGTWRFDERSRAWQALPRPEGWPERPLSLTLHRDGAGRARLLGAAQDDSAAARLWIATYDSERAAWHPAQTLQPTCAALPAVPPPMPGAPGLQAAWVRPDGAGNLLLFCSRQGPWWRVDVATPAADALAHLPGRPHTPVARTDDLWLARRSDGAWALGPLDEPPDAAARTLDPSWGRPLAFTCSLPALLLTLADGDAGNLMLTRLTC